MVRHHSLQCSYGRLASKQLQFHRLVQDPQSTVHVQALLCGKIPEISVACQKSGSAMLCEYECEQIVRGDLAMTRPQSHDRLNLVARQIAYLQWQVCEDPRTWIPNLREDNIWHQQLGGERAENIQHSANEQVYDNVRVYDARRWAIRHIAALPRSGTSRIATEAARRHAIQTRSPLLGRFGILPRFLVQDRIT